jgi:hypothetical protein
MGESVYNVSMSPSNRRRKKIMSWCRFNNESHLPKHLYESYHNGVEWGIVKILLQENICDKRFRLKCSIKVLSKEREKIEVK